MGRQQTLKERCQAIIRRFKYVDRSRFVYNDKSELKSSFSSIRIYCLIFDNEKGYSIFDFAVQRKILMPRLTWKKYFSEPVEGYENSIYSIITQHILPGINNRSGTEWVLKTILCWGINAVPKASNSKTPSRRNKTTN